VTAVLQSQVTALQSKVTAVLQSKVTSLQSKVSIFLQSKNTMRMNPENPTHLFIFIMGW
jgi:hypothetical protein